jgi:hypothetical protein
MPLPLPVIVVQAQFVPGTWTDITTYMRNFTVSRPSSRQQGPLLAFQAGTCSVLLKNDTGRFDPDNLAGPYAVTNPVRVVTLGSGTGSWKAPAGVAATMKVEAWGAGGGGVAGGGGGGEYAAEPAMAVIAGQVFTWSVGAGGAGGAAGGNTVFGTLTAHGGSAASGGTGGAGGTGSGATTHFGGGAGGNAGVAPGGGGASGGNGSAGFAGGSGGTAAGGGGAPAVPGGGPGGNGGATTGTAHAGSSPQAGPGGGSGGSAFGATSRPGAGGQIVITYVIAGSFTQVLPMVPVQIAATWPPNILTGDESTFEAGTAGWVGIGATVARSTAQAHSGTASLAVTSTSGGSIGASSATFAGFGGTYATYGIQVTAGDIVTVSGWWRAAAAARAVHMTIAWTDAAGNSLGGWNGAPVTDSTAGWAQASFTGVAPANVAWAIVQGGIDATAAAEVHYLDDVALAVARPLFTGWADAWSETLVNYKTGYSEVTLTATDAFKTLAGITLPALGVAAGAGEDTGARISRILDAAGWDPAARNISPGDSTLQATTFGDTVLNLCQLAADSEIGQLYTDGAGNVTFRHRQAVTTDPRSTTPQAVFGDSPGTVETAGTELAYGGLSRADDDTTLANDVQATIVGGNLQEVTDPDSVAKFGFARTYGRSDLILQTDTDANAWASYVLFTGKSDENRFETLTIIPARDGTSLWPQVLGRGIGDRIQIWRRPPGVAAPVTKNCFITGITHTFDASTLVWQTQWTLASADKYGSFFVLDDPVMGRLDFSALGW